MLITIHSNVWLGIHLPTEALGPQHGEVRRTHQMLNAALLSRRASSSTSAMLFEPEICASKYRKKESTGGENGQKTETKMDRRCQGLVKQWWGVHCWRETGSSGERWCMKWSPTLSNEDGKNQASRELELSTMWHQMLLLKVLTQLLPFAAYLLSAITNGAEHVTLRGSIFYSFNTIRCMLMQYRAVRRNITKTFLHSV